MKYLTRLITTLILVAVACGQNAPNIKGINVKGSSFDPQTKILKLVFINGSAADITAWVSCVRKRTEPPQELNTCIMRSVDAPFFLTQFYVEERKRPWLAGHWGTSEGSDVIHPGQEHAMEQTENQFPEVVNASMEIVALVFSDGTAWCANTPEAKEALREIVENRHNQLIMHQKVVEIASRVLSNPNDDHPADTMIAELKKRTHRAHMPEMHLGNGWQHVDANNRPITSEDSPEWQQVLEQNDTALYDFIHPHWREAKKEVIPANQRKYLKEYLADEQAWVEAWKKYQISETVVPE